MLAEAHEAATALLYQAASEPDVEGKRNLVREALSLIRARQEEYFTGPEAVYRQLEELSLNMEGVAVWVQGHAFRASGLAAPEAGTFDALMLDGHGNTIRSRQYPFGTVPMGAC